MSEDLIKRSDAIKVAENLLVRIDIKHQTDIEYGHNQGLINAIAGINDLPSADRPQGEWIEEEYKGRIYGIYRCQYKCSHWRIYGIYRCQYKCSHCGYVPMYRGEPIIPTNKILRFCPNCGAHMKGADDEV